MNCQTAQNLIEDYLDRRLVVLDRNEFVRHVSDCPSCEAELAAYRDVYEFLGDMEPEEVPRGFQNKVVSQLKAERLIYQPKVPALRRCVNAFLDLPGLAKYPLAAGAVIAALYFPLLLTLGRAEGFVARATVYLTEKFLSLQDLLGGVSFLANSYHAFERYAKLGKTVLATCFSAVFSAGDDVWIVSIGIFVAVLAVLGITLLKKKRSSHNAPFSF